RATRDTAPSHPSSKSRLDRGWGPGSIFPWSDHPTRNELTPQEARMAALICGVVYRGIFQKSLAARIARGIVLSARKSGRWGIAFGRYGDSPQRNGIPAKAFAIVADTQEER